MKPKLPIRFTPLAPKAKKKHWRKIQILPQEKDQLPNKNHKNHVLGPAAGRKGEMMEGSPIKIDHRIRKIETMKKYKNAKNMNDPTSSSDPKTSPSPKSRHSEKQNFALNTIKLFSFFI